MSDLGPVSQAILDYVNSASGYVELFRLINHLAWGPTATHTESWYFRRLVALAVEGHIEIQVFRKGDNVAIKFCRFEEKPKETGEVGENG